MPKSRNRKGHNQKSNQFRTDLLAARKKQKEEMMKKYMEQMKASQNMKRQQDGEYVENNDIQIDLDVDKADTNIVDVVETDFNVQDISNVVIEENQK
jgi:5'-3' exonuclease